MEEVAAVAGVTRGGVGETAEGALGDEGDGGDLGADASPTGGHGRWSGAVGAEIWEALC